MATNTAQIFVRTDAIDRLVKVTQAYLTRWGKSVRESWPDIPFLGTDAARTTRILPALEGWTCLLDPDAYRVDMDLARAVSAGMGCRVVALAIRGGELTWSHVTFEKGDVVREDRDPPEAFDEDRASGPMPMYSDVTRDALRLLLAEGVPQAYALLRFDELLDVESDEDDDALWVEELVTRPQEKEMVARSLQVQLTPRRARTGMMFRADLEGLSPEHRQVFVEIRTLFGTPEHHVVDSLLEIERADINRLQEAYLGREPDDVPEVQFEYSISGAPEEQLSGMLALRRDEFFSRRPTALQFLQIAIAAAKTDRSDWANVRPDGFGLVFRRVKRPTRRSSRRLVAGPRAPGVEVRSDSGPKEPETHIDLAGPYADFMAGRLVAETPEAAVGSYLSKAAADFDAAPEATAFDAVSGLLLPVVFDAEEAARLESNGVATRSLGHGLKIALSVRVGEGSALVERRDLEYWNVVFLEALGVARENLADTVTCDPRTFMEIDIGAGVTAFADLSGNGPAVKILSPDLPDVLRALAGTDDMLLAIPDIDSLFVCARTDDEARAELRAFARERLMAAETPLTAEPFRIRHDSVEEA